ncbi:MAG TPA: DUF5990 family protein [Chitinophagaceae bacterium]|nr:DUF5990 family protein [Chitinophagaceae bacterium]
MDITLSILLQKPIPGIAYGIQKGAGSNYETIQVVQSNGEDVRFSIMIQLKSDPKKQNAPRFTGPFVQGKPMSQFVYVDIGLYAGKAASVNGRIKIPLTGIDWNVINNLNANSAAILSTTVPASAKDGSPLFATVKNFEGWKVTAPPQGTKS